MKYILAPMILALSLPGLAMADFRVYGKANVALQHADDSPDPDTLPETSKVELVSNASRIGVKGSEVLTDELEAIFQFEYETQVDDGDKSGQTFSQRDIYVGVRGKAGTLLVGKVNTPLKGAQDKVDLFNDLEGDINYLFAGEVRANNVVQYKSPVFGEYFSGSVAYIASEEDGIDPGISATASYRNAGLYLAIAQDSDVQTEGSDLTRLVARYSIESVHVGAMFEAYESALVDEDGAFVSVLWEATDVWSFKAQAGSSDINSSGGESVSLGADYKLTGNAKLFGYYTNETNDVGCDGSGCDDQYLGVGMSLSF